MWGLLMPSETDNNIVLFKFCPYFLVCRLKYNRPNVTKNSVKLKISNPDKIEIRNKTLSLQVYK